MKTRRIAISSRPWTYVESVSSARGRPECESARTKNICSVQAVQKLTLYSFNVRDYCRLHAEFLAQRRSHAGIILAKQQHYSVGEQMRRLLKLIATKPAEEITNKIEFLSDWE